MSILEDLKSGEPLEVHASPHHEQDKPRLSLSTMLRMGANVVGVGVLAVGLLMSSAAHAASPSGGVELKMGGAGIAVGAATTAISVANQFHNGAQGMNRVAFNHAEDVAKGLGAQNVVLAQPGQSYSGKIVAVVDNYVVQSAGKGNVVLHNANNLNFQGAAAGVELNVKYLQNGQALTTPSGVGHTQGVGR